MEPEQNGRPLTFGEKLAGVSFNPSKSPSVDDVKATAANFIDSIHSAEARIESNIAPEFDVRGMLFKEAKLRALEAQMLAVKAITWQD